MSEWDVHLVFIDEKSKKFWRARKEKSDLFVNWGRIGTDGQTQLKEFESAAACAKEYEKLVEQKRSKGYVDEGSAGGGGGEEEPTEVPKSASAGRVVDLSLESGRKVELRLSADGNTIRTVVVEKFKNAADAQATLGRIQEAMEAEGYRNVKRTSL